MVKWHSINENECIETFYHSPEDSSTQAGIKHQSFIEVNKRQVKFRRDVYPLKVGRQLSQVPHLLSEHKAKNYILTLKCAGKYIQCILEKKE